MKSLSDLAPDDPRHGRYATYTVLRCRCDLCRKANADAARKRRAEPSSQANGSMRARSRAENAAATWVRHNHPEVWASLLEEAHAALGVPRLMVGRPRKKVEDG